MKQKFKTEKEWDMFFIQLNELEKNICEQYPKHATSTVWALSLVRVQAAFDYAEWMGKHVLKGLKK